MPTVKATLLAESTLLWVSVRLSLMKARAEAAGTVRPEQEAAGTTAMSRDTARNEWARDVVIAVIASLLIILFLYQPVRVEGTSMVPMLQDQDRLFISKIAYRVGTIHRGDVVVFQYPRDPSKSYIKRVVGLPGDRVAIQHGTVYINGNALPEPYVPSRYSDERSMAETEIPKGEYFMMGDHRSISFDSREFGPVNQSLIYGKAEFVYWPFREAGVVH